MFDAASVGGGAAGHGEQSTAHIEDTRKAFPWCGIVHGVSDVLIAQMNAGMSRKHEDEVCRFWEAGSCSWRAWQCSQ
jgi:hypothetical protein